MSTEFRANIAYDPLNLGVKQEEAAAFAIDLVCRQFWTWLMVQHRYPVPVTGWTTYNHDSVSAVIVAGEEGAE